MNARILWVRVMECMCAQTRPRFVLSSKRVLGGWSKNPRSLQGKKVPSTGKILPRGGSNPRRFIKQDSEPNILPTSYFGPLTVSITLGLCLSVCLSLWVHFLSPPLPPSPPPSLSLFLLSRHKGSVVAVQRGIERCACGHIHFEEAYHMDISPSLCIRHHHKPEHRQQMPYSRWCQLVCAAVYLAYWGRKQWNVRFMFMYAVSRNGLTFYF